MENIFLLVSNTHPVGLERMTLPSLLLREEEMSFELELIGKFWWKILSTIHISLIHLFLFKISNIP